MKMNEGNMNKRKGKTFENQQTKCWKVGSLTKSEFRKRFHSISGYLLIKKTIFNLAGLLSPTPSAPNEVQA